MTRAAFDGIQPESTFSVVRYPLTVARFTAFNAVKRATVNGQRVTGNVDSPSPFPVAADV